MAFDQLNQEDADDVLSSILSGVWDSPIKKILYGQYGDNGAMILHANPALAGAIGKLNIGEITTDILSGWISSLSAASALDSAVFAGQSAFSEALRLADVNVWPIRPVRVARHGDCQAASNFGTAEEEAATDRALKTVEGVSSRCIAAVEVLGTNLVLVKANFPWDEGAFFLPNVKSSRTFDEFCELIIPQFVAKKSVEAILFLEPSLEQRTRKVARLTPYMQLFKVQADPDDDARANRQLLRERLQSAPSSSGEPNTDGGLTWLERARARFGLRANSAATTDAADHLKSQQLLRTFLDLTRTDENATIQRLLSSIQSTVTSGSSSEQVVLGIRLLAEAKLGTIKDKEIVDHIQKDGAERQIWWKDTAFALTHKWIKSSTPANWISVLAKKDAKLLRTVAMESDHAYEKVRSELSRLGGQINVDLLLPFSTLEQEQGDGDAYRRLVEDLKSRVESKIDQKKSKRSLVLSRDVTYFRITFSTDGLADHKKRELLDLAREAFGNSSSHFNAEVAFKMSQDDLPSAEKECLRWRDMYPNDADAWLIHGKICFKGKRFAEALECFLKSMELAHRKNLARKNKAREDKAQLWVAKSLWALDRDEEAEAELCALIARAPSPEARVTLGKVFFYNERFLEARDALKSVEIEDIYNCYGLYEYLVSLLNTIDVKEALDVYAEWCPRLSSGEIAKYIAVASHLLYSQEQPLQAVSLFKDSLKYESDWDDAVSWVAYCCWVSGDLPGSRGILERALEAPCASSGHYFDLARTYMYAMEPGDRNLALSFEIASKGCKIFTEDWDLWLQAGESAVFANENGQPYFERTIDLIAAIPESERSTARGCFAFALLNLKRTAEARFELEQELLAEDNIPVSLINLLIYALAVTLDSGRVAPELYRFNRPILESHTEQREILRWHMIDLELFEQRGIHAEWDSIRRMVERCLCATT